MKNLKQYIEEKLLVNKNYKNVYSYNPETWDELRQIVKDRFKEQGVGTKKTPINFNDIDVTAIDTLSNDKHIGVFSNTDFEYIDVSKWDVSNITNMTNLFNGCKYLRSLGNLSKWNVSNVKNFINMFNECHDLRSVGNLSKWKTLNAENMDGMFMECMSLRSVGDLSNWKVSKVKDMGWMFFNCVSLKSVGDLSKWDISNIKGMVRMFTGSAITNIPKWYKL